MNNKVYVGRRAGSFARSGDIRAVEGVVLVVDEDHEFRAGDMDGNVLEVPCPYGTQAMADDLLTQLQGRTYTGYTAENAVADPAAELGDGVTVGGIYSLLASREVSFGSGHLGRIGAPAESDMDHEYAAADSYTRGIERKLAGTRSYIDKKSDEIRLGVESLVDDRMAALDVTLESITGTVKGINGDVAELKVSVGSISGTVTGLDGEVSDLKQTASSLSGRIQSAEGDITELEATAKGLSSSVKGLDGRVSTIEQTAGKITIGVSGSLGGSASITLYSDGAYLDSASLNLKNVRSAFATENSNIVISAGTVTFDTGKFISTGTNFAVDAQGYLTANSAHFLGEAGYVGWKAQYVASLNEGNILLTYDDTRDDSNSSFSVWGIPKSQRKNIPLVYAMTWGASSLDYACLGAECNVYLCTGTDYILRADHTITTTSDRDKKKDIKPLDERYLRFLDLVPPASFRFRGQADDAPLSLGYVAQDVEKALFDAELTRGDFASLFGEDGSGEMGLRYEDFIPILHLKLKALEARIEGLEGKI